MITDLYRFNVDPEDMRSTLLGPTAERVKAEMVKAIANDADGKIRQALIDLGWTPPATCQHAAERSTPKCLTCDDTETIWVVVDGEVTCPDCGYVTPKQK